MSNKPLPTGDEALALELGHLFVSAPMRLETPRRTEHGMPPLRVALGGATGRARGGAPRARPARVGDVSARADRVPTAHVRQRPDSRPPLAGSPLARRGLPGAWRPRAARGAVLRSR